MLADLKYIFRKLRKSPGFTLTAIVTLALGIGVNAVVFSVLNALILRPLNVPHPDNLYMVERGRDYSASQSYPDYLDLRDRNTTFSGLATQNIEQAGIDTGNNPSKAWIYETSGNYFDVLGVRPYLGRFFHPSDEHGTNSSPLIVLSYDYWRNHFNSDSGIVGKTVLLNRHPFTILGVAQPGFRGMAMFFSPDLWVPMVNEQQFEGWDYLHDRGDHTIGVIGRLKDGVTPAEAAANLNAIAGNLAKTYPKQDEGLLLILGRPGLLGDQLGGPARAFLAGIMLLAGLILLAACANLGSLFAARAGDRSREIALRLALGSNRRRIVRDLLTEAVLVSLVGGMVGLVGGVALLHWLSAWHPIPDVPINVPINPDFRTYALALLLSLASGLLFGLVPVRQVLRANSWQVIRSGAPVLTGRRLSVRDALLVVQIALCAVLVTSSLVAVRGLVLSLHSNFGFDPHHAMLVRFDLRMADYTDEQSGAAQQRILQSIKTIPGVEAAGYANQVPLDLSSSDSDIFANGTVDFRPANAVTDASFFQISPGYLAASRTPLIGGRDLNWHDGPNAPKVALVNATFAQKLFGSPARALGGYFLRGDGSRIQVVGVFADGKYDTLTEDPRTAIFYPILQSPGGDTVMVVRSNRPAADLAAALEAKVRGVEPGLPFTIQAWNERLGIALFPARTATVSLGVLGVLGAMLAITGIFGMASYSVGKRLRELGIRVALGARRQEVLGAALGRAGKLLAIGSAAGLLLGIAAGKILSSIVYQATSRDPLVLVGVILTMLLLGLFATWIPARRALAVDPAILLREE